MAHQPRSGGISRGSSRCCCVGGGLGAPLDPEEVRKLGLDTFTSPTGTSGPGPGVLPVGEGNRHGKTSKKVDEAAPFLLGEALPVVLAKLVKKIVRGEFVDMVELLRDNMAV